MHICISKQPLCNTLAFSLTVENLDQEGLFSATAKENISEFSKYVTGVNWEEQLLTRNDPVYVRCVNAEQAEQDKYLEFTADIDGCVVEMTDMRGISMDITHITFYEKGKTMLQRISHRLRKHIDVNQMSTSALRNFSHCLGFQVFYQNGWDCIYGLIPDETARQESITTEMITLLSEDHFLKLKRDFRLKLQDAARRQRFPKSMAKNNIVTFNRFRILPDEQRDILGLLQDAMDAVSPPTALRRCLFLYKFGEKREQPMDLSCFNKELVNKVTIHIACNIHSKTQMDLLWSTTGITQVVGNRGTITPCLSMNECGNFQSNLDGRMMDISPDLRKVFRYPERMTFIQLYADVPHNTPTARKHPVSGSICCIPLLWQKQNEALKKDAMHYISTMMSNFMAMYQSSCRIEAVLDLPLTGDVLAAPDFIHRDNLASLLQKYPLLVPFQREEHSLMSVMKDTGRHLVKSLDALKRDFTSTGNQKATWTALQMELALEKLLVGHPLDYKAKQSAILLGTGVGYWTGSKTDILGFLALEDDISLPELPPIQIWTPSQTYQNRIKKMFGYHDTVVEQKDDVASETIHRLLRDLHDKGKVVLDFPNFLNSLKGQGPITPPVVGCVTVRQLSQLLSKDRRIAYPMVFGCIRDILSQNEYIIEDTLMEGLIQCRLQFFPAIQTTDQHRHAILDYKATYKYWRVVGHDLSTTSTSDPVLSEIVKAELQAKGLIFESKLQQVICPFSWIQPSLDKLNRQKTKDHDTIIRQLCYISAIVFISNGWYVDYSKLEELESTLPGRSNTLRLLEILGKIPLKQNQKFFRLHPSIPRIISVKEAPTKGKEREETAIVTEQQQAEDDNTIIEREEDLDNFDLQDVSEHFSQTLPANAKRGWSCVRNGNTP